MSNIDKQEIKKFSDIADEWWNKDGDFKPLHVINPLRANYIKDKVDLKRKKIFTQSSALRIRVSHRAGLPIESI